jgi:hypothetical protein
MQFFRFVVVGIMVFALNLGCPGESSDNGPSINKDGAAKDGSTKDASTKDRSVKDKGIKDRATNDTGAKDKRSTDSPIIETGGATIEVSCTYQGGIGGTMKGTAQATNLEACTYKDSSKSLHVSFIGSSAASKVQVDISPFTGDGIYKTTADGKINVIITAPGLFADVTPTGLPSTACPITATSNFSKITIPSSGEAKVLDVSLHVSCPKLIMIQDFDGSKTTYDCTPSPQYFNLSVKGCSVSQ